MAGAGSRHLQGPDPPDQRQPANRALERREHHDAGGRALGRHHLRRGAALREDRDHLAAGLHGGMHGGPNRGDGHRGAPPERPSAAARVPGAEHVLLGLLDDAVHDPHRAHRVLPRGGLRRQHDRGGTVVDGVAHVRGRSPCRAWVGDHGFQHLGGCEHRHPCLHRPADDLLLQGGNRLGSHLHPHVAARDHQTIRRIGDLVEVLDGLGTLDLGDQPGIGALLLHQPPQSAKVLGSPHERQRNVVCFVLQRTRQVLQVLLGESIPGHLGAREVDAFVRLQETTVHHLGVDLRPGHLQHAQLEVAIVQEDALLPPDILGQVLVGGADTDYPVTLRLPSHDTRLGGDDHALIRLQPDRLGILERAHPDLRPLQIHEHAEALLQAAVHTADPADHPCNLCWLAVGRVDPKHVHARHGEFPQPGF